MTTLRELSEQTLNEIGAYTRNQESVTVLTQPATADDLTFTVDDVSSLSKGTVEIDDELVYLKRINSQSGTVEVMPGGRGWSGSTASAHDALTIMRNNPLFSRSQIKRAINDTIIGIDLMSIGSYDFTFDGSTFAYPLPADFKNVTGISWEVPDTTGIWDLITRYRIDRNYRVEGSSAVRSALILDEAPMPGQTVRVQYARFPSALEDADDFSTTGLPVSAQDVVRLGAMWRLVSTVDPGKVIANTPSSEVIDAAVQPGQSTATARYIYQLFSVRLAEEKTKQMINYMSVINYQR